MSFKKLFFIKQDTLILKDNVNKTMKHKSICFIKINILMFIIKLKLIKFIIYKKEQYNNDCTVKVYHFCIETNKLKYVVMQ